MEREVEPHPSVSLHNRIEIRQALITVELVFILGAVLFAIVGVLASVKPLYQNYLSDLCWRVSAGALMCSSIAMGVIGVFNTFFKPEALGERSLARVLPAARRHLRLYGIAEVWASAWTIKLFVSLLVDDPFAHALPPAFQSLVVPFAIAAVPLVALRIFLR